MIDDFKKIKVLIVGETIIDQYIFCEALGKSGKEPILVLRDIKTEEYLGGAAALARHVSPFCDNITLLSMVGEKSEYLQQIKKKLPKNINFKYIKKENSPTILKRRFLDHVNKNKVLGVYKINDEILPKKQDKLFYNILDRKEEGKWYYRLKKSHKNKLDELVLDDDINDYPNFFEREDIQGVMK